MCSVANWSGKKFLDMESVYQNLWLCYVYQNGNCILVTAKIWNIEENYVNFITPNVKICYFRAVQVIFNFRKLKMKLFRKKFLKNRQSNFTDLRFQNLPKLSL